MNQAKRIFSIRPADLVLANLSIFAFLLFIPIFTYTYFAGDLVSTEAIMNKNNTGIVLYDRENHPFFTFYHAQPKDYIPLSAIPEYTQEAVIAMEDKDFYSHPGFSVKSIIRALWNDIANRDLAYGGSTITQQLVKNALLSPRKNFLRKYQEVVLANEIERRYSKKQIMEMYLNSAYFGEGAFGVQEAAKTYFNIPVEQLNLAQSSFLAALLPAPSALSPYSGNPEKAQERQIYILEKMLEQGYISEAEKIAAENEKLVFHPPEDPLNSQGVHFALMVRDELVNKYGEEAVSRAGLRVITTIDLDLQDFAEKTVARQVEQLSPNRVSNGAAVVENPKTGEILALVGSKDWHNKEYGKVNVALQPRQPGSSFKPIYYSAALEKGLITAATTLHDQPTTFPGGYKPRDYDNKFRGQVTARRALSNSLNVPSVEVISKLGIATVLEQAEDLGLTTLGNDTSQYGLSLALGAGEVKLLELTTAYAVFANQGEWNPPTSILEIKDKNNQLIYKYQPDPKSVVSAPASFLISSILSDNKARSEIFGDVLNISRPAAVKTGTTENYRDSLTLGYTPSVTVGVWVGNNDGAPMDNVAGSLGAAPIWKSLMEYYLAGTPVENFPVPEGIISVDTCFTLTQAGNDDEKKEKEDKDKEEKRDSDNSGQENRPNPTPRIIRVNEYFIRGTEPRNLCSQPRDRKDSRPENPPGDTPSSSPSESPAPTAVTPILTQTIIPPTPTPN